MIPQKIKLSPGKKIYFASDFHLGVPDHASSLEREKFIVKWLDKIKQDAEAIFLVGDIFDFWFEYKYAVPKGFIRLQGKLAEISDSGIPLFIFTGNHDMWMFDYFHKELNIPVLRQPIEIEMGNHQFFIGHGDGLGPGDHFYKFLKKVFANKLMQKMFAFVHPRIGMGIAHTWSRHSRITNIKNDKDRFLGEKEWLYIFCKEQESIKHRDFYIFGHRHIPLDMKVAENSRYINLGEWVNFTTYAVYDGKNIELKTFKEECK